MKSCLLSLTISGLLALSACATAPTRLPPTLAVLPSATSAPPATVVTPVPTATDTVAAALAPSASPTLAPATLTPTPIPPTTTPTPTAAPTETAAPPTLTTEPSLTPSMTITKTITPTPSQTLTPTVDAGQFSSLLDLAARVTVLPPEVRYGPETATALWEIGNQYAATALAAQPTAAPAAATQGPGVVVLGVGTLAPLPNGTPLACATLPGGALGGLLAGDAAFAALIGCPVGAPVSVAGAFQLFERGVMIYRAAAIPGMAGTIEALSADSRFSRAADSWISGVDPESYGLAAPPGLVAPIRGFGKVWISDSALGTRLGWATAPEQGVSLTVQAFERGVAVYVPAQNVTYVLAEDMAGALAGSWRQMNGGF